MRVLALALLALLLLPAAAAADATVEIDSQIRMLRIEADGDSDRITVTQDAQGYLISRPNGGLTSGSCTAVGNALRCDRQLSLSVDMGGGNDTFTTSGLTDPVAVFGGIGDDDLSGGADTDVLAGGDGNDRLNGFGGVDDYFGGDGSDFIQATDGLAERLSCGGGNDQVHNDFIDILAECESGVDADGDNFSSAVDCNDANPAISPGAVEIFENGIDEDCDGRDGVNFDRDGDGFPVPADCNDGDPAIRPGALEVKGNAVDENCDTRAEPFALLRALVLNNWEVDGRVTRLRKLQVRNAPRGARIVFRCTGPGCPTRRRRVRTVPRDLAPITLHTGFRRARLRPGARLTVTVTAPETTGRTWSYRVKNGQLPDPRTTCRSPGESGSRPC